MHDPLIVGAAELDAGVACVLIHGRGQTPEDMADIATAAGLARCRFVLPRAEGKSWYKAKAVDPMTPATLAELTASLAQVDAAMTVARATGVPVLLAGFSQGACIAAEYLFRVAPADAACLFTGCRVGRAPDGAPLPALPGLPVYLGCGDADDWIPLDHFIRLGHDLAQAGARVRADVFPGRPHQVSPVEIEALSAMLDDLAAGRRPLGGAQAGGAQ